MVVSARDGKRGRNGIWEWEQTSLQSCYFSPGLRGGEEGATGVHGGGVSREGVHYQGPEGESLGMDVIAPNLPATFSQEALCLSPAGSDGAQRSPER